MTREEFINVLSNKRIEYYKSDGKLVIIDTRSSITNIDLEVDSLPPDIEFKNPGSVTLSNLKSFPKGIVFKNEGAVSLDSLQELSNGVDFSNFGNVELWGLESIPKDFRFNNRGWVYTKRFHPFLWDGHIHGIGFERLFNEMIRKGIFL